jgi:hypothetical protein
MTFFGRSARLAAADFLSATQQYPYVSRLTVYVFHNYVSLILENHFATSSSLMNESQFI